MECTIAVFNEHFSPAGKFAPLRVSRKIATIDDDLILIILAAAQVCLAPLVAILNHICDGGPTAGATPIEKNDEFVGFIALVDVECWR